MFCEATLMNVQRLLVTGANGFVGNALCVEAVARGYAVRGATRTVCDFPLGVTNVGVENVAVGDISANTDWHSAILNCDVVIHLAARVHVMREGAGDPLTEFRLVNTAATEHLARCAAAGGVRRLVYVSSIGVNGLFTDGNAKFSEQDHTNPHNAYALSKWEAEQALHRVAAETGLEVVILRPPLVYGAGAPGNFSQMLRAAVLGVPLPLAGIKNKRDLVYVGNLVDALMTCATHPVAAGNTYLVSDGEAISTPNLLRGLANALGVSSRVFACPNGLLKLVGALFGKAEQVERLVGSLQVDSSKIRRELGWVPPYSLQEGLGRTVIGDCTKF
jgi:nucleoside-diphosphate-sugar epimerase